MSTFRKIILWLLLIVVLAVLSLGLEHLYFTRFVPHPAIKWGLNFSQYYAQKKLDLGWKAAYLAILDELAAKRLRLVAYWDLVEAQEPGKYEFSDLDWQMEEAYKRNIDVILAIGYRVPRWPECFEPTWLRDYGQQGKRQALLNLLKAEVEHFKKYNNIMAWQVENEPLFSWFGECPRISHSFLKQEVALVRSLDSRPVLLTVSGELSTWWREAGLADILGTSIYRTVWSSSWLGRGYQQYHLPADFYRWKGYYVKSMIDKLIITEMQAEPWAPENKDLKNISWQEQDKSMSFEKFNEALNYAQSTGIEEIYLWGAEWWWWRKLQGDDRFWEKAKEVISAGQ